MITSIDPKKRSIQISVIFSDEMKKLQQNTKFGAIEVVESLIFTRINY